MADWLIILLLPCAAWSGWWLAMRKEARDLRADKTRAAYFEGVGFLLNDQTDRAVDVFIHMADLDQQMLDNQLTLGSLFRKRGELDRALHLHQQLRSHSQLTDAQRMAVDYELAEDYAAAGMYSQAQALFEQLLAASYRPAEVMPALAHLYERTKQWQAALVLSEQWQAKGYGARGKEISHYYCELAQQAGDDAAAVANYLQLALAADRDCVRANRMRGQLYLRQGDEISLPDKDKPTSTQELAELIDERSGEQGVQFGSPLATVRHATYVRREHALATGPFAFVVGLDWCPTDVLTFLNRDILVLVNTSEQGVALPEQAQVLLASGALLQEDRHLVVPPTTTVWLSASTVA